VKIAVIGGGWAGLAAAVRATEAGHAVALFEMARQLGGRARTVAADDQVLDNGQHILIGAYSRCLALMRMVGCDVEAVLDRRPLELRYPDGRGLRMPDGPAWLALAWAVARCRGWQTRDRLSLMRAASRWALSGFHCHPALSVAELCGGLRPAVRQLLIDPLCVAALNTPTDQASGQVFLRVLGDALFGGAGSADLLLPRRPLGDLLPVPARSWLDERGARVVLGRRVLALQAGAPAWLVDGERFDRVILACTAAEASRLAEESVPAWAGMTAERKEALVAAVHPPSRCWSARLPAAAGRPLLAARPPLPRPGVAEGDQRAHRAAPVHRAPHPERPDHRPASSTAHRRPAPTGWACGLLELGNLVKAGWTCARPRWARCANCTR
jgi:predicted NAD/FAD-binding protein